jgi:hypothetical protein
MGRALEDPKNARRHMFCLCWNHAVEIMIDQVRKITSLARQTHFAAAYC